MDKLRSYINSLSAEARDDFARRCGTSIGYMRKAISVDQKFGAELCVLIERESRRAVHCEDLRPDVDWGVLRRHFTPGPELARAAEPAKEGV